VSDAFRAGLDRNTPAVEIVDERGEHLVVEMGDEEVGRRRCRAAGSRDTACS
jgi:hypothetical protein